MSPSLFDGIGDERVGPRHGRDLDPYPYATGGIDKTALNNYTEAFDNGRPCSPIFNGTYTIQNRETGEHRTFRIRTQGKDSSFAPGRRVLSLLTGSDNTRDYTGFAFVNDDADATIYVWQNRKGYVYDGYAKLLRWLLVDKAEKVLAVYEVLAESRCIVCNRPLTHPESVKTGIGPICAGRG
jgi:hypothetical protein